MSHGKSQKVMAATQLPKAMEYETALRQRSPKSKTINIKELTLRRLQRNLQTREVCSIICKGGLQPEDHPPSKQKKKKKKNLNRQRNIARQQEACFLTPEQTKHLQGSKSCKQKHDNHNA